MADVAQELIHRHRLSVDDYHLMAEAGILHEDSRVELINGDVVDMPPIGSEHAGTVKQLSRLFTLAIGQSALVSTQDPVVLGESSEPEPNIALLRSREDFYKSSHPGSEDILLIVEVADSSVRYDREVKVPLFAQYEIPEVWLVDLPSRVLEIYQDPAGGRYRRLIRPGALGMFSPKALPEVTFDLSGLF